MYDFLKSFVLSFAPVVFLMPIFAVAGDMTGNVIIQPGLQRMVSDQPNYYRHYVTPSDASTYAYTNQGIVASSLEQAIKTFKIWFNLSIQSSDQLIDSAAIIIANYYEKLRLCQPGTYQYPEPNIFFGWRINNKIEPKYFLARAKIVGKQNNYCVVDLTITKNNNVTHSECRYSSQALALFTYQRARKAARNNLSYRGNEMSRFQRTKEECKILEMSHVH